MMKHLRKNQANESGAVAILSVIFFMILLSVLVVSFVRIVVREGTQTRDNELSASALSAAQAGVEDAKRVLVYCASVAPGSPEEAACQTALNKENDCNAITGSAVLQDNVKLNTQQRAGSSAIEGVVGQGDGSDSQQFYSCLQIFTQTRTVDDINVIPGSSEIIKLDVVGPNANPPYVTFSWHIPSPDMDKSVNIPAGTVDAPAKFDKKEDWITKNYPAVMRVEVVRIPKSGFQVQDLPQSAFAATLVPATGGDGAVNLVTYTPRTEPNATPAPLRGVKCTNAATDAFACSTNISVGTYDMNQFEYYLRISSTYRSAHMQLALPAGYNFNNVQPRVDSTGRTNDVFRRVSARLRMGAQGVAFIPEYAIESGSTVCKKMQVSSDTVSSVDNCAYID